jgi:hypothetical protein
LRKIISILLLSIIFLSELGYYFCYTLQQYQVKREVKRELLNNVASFLLEKIELEKNIQSIEWEEEGKEFYLAGQLYDVHKTIVENGKTILYCLNDVKEEELIKQMNNAAQPGNHKDKSLLKLTLSYCIVETPLKISAPLSSAICTAFFYFDETALPANKEINVPPPRT